VVVVRHPRRPPAGELARKLRRGRGTWRQFRAQPRQEHRTQRTRVRGRLCPRRRGTLEPGQGSRRSPAAASLGQYNHTFLVSTIIRLVTRFVVSHAEHYRRMRQ
jgi:hypothetical protein